jgi:O-antigen/teichoic acid export membrane protein
MSVLLLVWIFKLGVLGAALTQIIIAFSVAIYYIVKVSRHYKIVIRPVSPIPKLLFLKGFGFATTLFIINLNYKIDILFLEHMVTPAEIGVYSVGVNFAELLWQIPAAVGMVLFAKSTTTRNKNESIERSTAILRMVMPIMVVASIIIAIITPELISNLYGVSFLESGSVLRILLPGIVFITISKVLHPDLAGRGQPLFALRVFVFTLVINIVLNFVFIPEYGINGAALASTISYILAGIGFGIVYARKEKIPLKKLLILNRSDIKRIKKIIFKE